MCGREAECVFLALGHYKRDVFDFEQDGIIPTRFCLRRSTPICIPFCAVGSSPSWEILVQPSLFQGRFRAGYGNLAADMCRNLVEELYIRGAGS
jgi:hypothetical protein